MDHGSERVNASLGDAILAASADAILATDRQGVIRFWNPGAIRMFGFAERDALGASLDIIIPQRLRQRHWDGWKAVMAKGETGYGGGYIIYWPCPPRQRTVEGSRSSSP